MFFLLEKQIPMAVVSPGKQPKTRAERDRVTKSGAEVLFNESDLNDIYKQGFPVVIGFNNRNHNCSTVIIPPSDYNYWKVQNIETQKQKEKENQQICTCQSGSRKEVKKYGNLCNHHILS